MSGRRISVEETAAWLKEAQDVWILVHQNPDGDALGSAFGLRQALIEMGRRAAVISPDPLPPQYDFLYPEGYTPEPFEPQTIVAVDLASPSLMGRYRDLAPRVDLCIDHHASNTGYAATTCLETEAAAAGEVVMRIIEAMGHPISPYVADALYLAIASDSGGFRYANTRPETLKLAARLMDLGARHTYINHRLFESKPRGLVAVEGRLMTEMRFFCNGLCAVVRLPRSLLDTHGLTDADADGLSAIPRNVEGVEVGITLRERPNEGVCRVSVRTSRISAGDLCARFGGGGHRLAAGCTVKGSLEEVEARLVAAVDEALRAEGLL
jgi:phosphoesterase RecJ-like protein